MNLATLLRAPRRMASETIIKTIDGQEWIEETAKPLQKAVRDAFVGPAGRELKNFLHGTWLGHPLHPVLTDRALVALLGQQEPGRRVEQEPGTADERQHDDGDPEDDGVEVEVVAEASAHTGDDAVAAAALEAPVGRSLRRDLVLAGGHGSIMRPAPGPANRGSP